MYILIIGACFVLVVGGGGGGFANTFWELRTIWLVKIVHKINTDSTHFFALLFFIKGMRPRPSPPKWPLSFAFFAKWHALSERSVEAWAYFEVTWKWAHRSHRLIKHLQIGPLCRVNWNTWWLPLLSRYFVVGFGFNSSTKCSSTQNFLKILHSIELLLLLLKWGLLLPLQFRKVPNVVNHGSLKTL